MTEMLAEFRYALRSLRRAPLFAAIVISTLAIGIGANTAVFSLIHGILLEPLPYLDSERLVFISVGDGMPASPLHHQHLDDNLSTVELLTAAHPAAPVLRGDGPPIEIDGLRATPQLFDLLGVDAAIGRTFSPAEDNENVVILGHELWQRQFGSDRQLVGRTVSLDSESYTVIGVMPPGFEFPPFWATEAELWLPLSLKPPELGENARYLRLFGRLTDSASVEQARDELEAEQAFLATTFADHNEGLDLTLDPLLEPTVGGSRRALMVLFGAVILVLMIACANIANLLLVRARTRQRELAIRSALGAGSGHLLLRMLSEGLLLAAAGGALGVLVGTWTLDLVVKLAGSQLPRLTEVGLDAQVMLFAFLLTMIVGVVFALIPGLRVLRWHVPAMLRIGNRTETTADSRARRLLAIAQVGLAAVLLIGAGLLLRSFEELRNIDPGFAVEQVVAVDLSLAGTEHEEPSRQSDFYRQVTEVASAVPGVERAALINHLPVGGDRWGAGFQIRGRETDSRQDGPGSVWRLASPGLFRALGVPLVNGREFTTADHADGAPVAIISTKLAQRYWPDENPIGQQLRQGGPDSTEPWRRIVGVIGDVRQWTLT